MRIAFTEMPGTKWIAGIHYLKNLWLALRAVKGEPSTELVLIVSPTAKPESYDTLKPHLDQVLFWPVRPPESDFRWRQSLRLQRSLGVWLGPGDSLASFLRRHRVDCLFTSTQFGPRFSVPLLSWIFDFQHLHLPEMFSPEEIRSRTAGYSAIATHADRVILSSQDALHDFKHFAPSAVHKARVLSFVAQVPVDAYASNPAWVCDYYHLPRRFIYLPNQFWKHKNHTVVLEALAIAMAEHPEIAVICTGSTTDHRNPNYLSELLPAISERDLREHFILLGLVPHSHVFPLLRQSLAMLQPSLFEGWSTTVEEAKSLGKRVILSDIATHREQDPPGAVFFDPHDPRALAACMVAAFENLDPGPDHELEGIAQEQLPARTEAFGRTFMEIALEVACTRTTSVDTYSSSGRSDGVISNAE